MNSTVETLTVPVADLTPQAFARYGTVVLPTEDGTPFGPDDARLDLSGGIPRFYAMRVPARGLTIGRITRHRAVTQALASAGGDTWYIGVAPPGDAPALDAIAVFRVPGDTAVVLHKGAWHVGPLFEGKDQSFFNLELSDTNVVDHDTCELAERFGRVLKPAV